MSGDQSLMYWQEKLGKTQPRMLEITLQITGAKTNTPVPLGQPILTTYDAIASQAVIDNFFGITGEFPLADYDATSMGANALGILVDMHRQVKSIVRLDATLCTGTGGGTQIPLSVIGVGLTASTLETALGLSPSGNLGIKISFGATLDAATSGLVKVQVYWISK